MSTHAKLSPSKRHRWAVCPASVREEQKYPDERSGASAIDGTHTHTALEWSIKNYPTKLTVGQVLQDDDGEFTCDRERIERVQVAMDYIWSLKSDTNIIHSEVRTNGVMLTGRKDLDGTVDVHVESGDVLHVIDYKDGRSSVTAENNDQLEQYGINLLADHTYCGIPKFKTVRMTIIQPKLPTAITHWDVDATELVTTRLDRLVAQAKATDDPDALFNPGEAQCKYCKHKGACSALTGQLMEASGIAFQNLEVAQEAADKDPSTMTDQQLKELVEAAPLLRQMLEAAEEEALRRMKDGKPIDGLKVVRGRGSRGWAFPDEVMAEKLVKMGVPKGAVWETKLLSPAKAEKVRWTKRDGTEKQLNEKQLALLHSEYIKKSDGKLTVASVSDDRPAVEFGAAHLFESVELPEWLIVNPS